jgi:hypothetical protein
MSMKSLVATGLAQALGNYLVADIGGSLATGAVKILKEHLSLDGRDLANAFQDSLGRGATAIALGLSPEGVGVLTRLGQGARPALAPKIAQTYARGVETGFLLPYAQAQGLDPAQTDALRRAALDPCRALADRRAAILPPADLDDAALAALARGTQREILSELLLERATQVLPGLDPQVRGLLAHRGLLGDALLWFLRERLRTDPASTPPRRPCNARVSGPMSATARRPRPGTGPSCTSPPTPRPWAPWSMPG